MTLPCEQKDNIININHTLLRVEKSQDKLIELLETVAEQKSTIIHLVEHSENFHQDINNLYGRVRDVELVQAEQGPEARIRLNGTIEELTRKMDSINVHMEKILRFYNITTGKWARYVYGFFIIVVLGGFILDVFAHGNVIAQAWSFWRRGI